MGAFLSRRYHLYLDSEASEKHHRKHKKKRRDPSPKVDSNASSAVSNRLYEWSDPKPKAIPHSREKTSTLAEQVSPPTRSYVKHSQNRAANRPPMVKRYLSLQENLQNQTTVSALVSNQGGSVSKNPNPDREFKVTRDLSRSHSLVIMRSRTEQKDSVVLKRSDENGNHDTRGVASDIPDRMGGTLDTLDKGDKASGRSDGQGESELGGSDEVTDSVREFEVSCDISPTKSLVIEKDIV